MAADGSKNHTSDGGRGPGGPASSARLRAEEVVERGLRLYAHGDLVGALAEWRRALEMDQGNRRGRDYVAYVEGHFDVLSEKFRTARERLGSALEPSDLAIEIEADDPMEDMEPYESIELDRAAPPGGALARASGDDDDDDENGESTVPAPGAPHLRGEVAGGKQSAGRRPWGRRAEREPVEPEDAPWPPLDDWPQSARSDTLEMAVDPSLLEELELEGLRVVSADGALAASDVADVSPTDESADEPGRAEDEPGSATIDDVLDAVEEEEDSQTGEVTLPARPPPTSGSAITLDAPEEPPRERALVRMTAEGSGQIDDRVSPPVPPSGSARGLPAGPPKGPALGSGRAPVGRPHSAVDAEAWADGTPPIEPEAAEPTDRPELADLDECALADLPGEELREVRVTFRRSNRTSGPPPIAEGEVGEEETLEPEPVAQHGRDRDDDRVDVDDYGPEEDSDEVEEEELTIERHGVSARASVAARRESPTAPVPGRRKTHDTDADRTTTEMQAQPRPLAHSAIAIDLVSSELTTELHAAMAAAETSGDDYLRERVVWLIGRARRENQQRHFPTAVLAIDLALEENPESAVAQKLIHSHRDLLYEIYGNYLGDLRAVPGLAMPMSAIPLSELDHRSAFLLSRVDGVLSLEDVLDVSGMARLEAFRHLSRLMLRGILEIRP